MTVKNAQRHDTHAGHCQQANGTASERLIGEPQDSGLAYRLWRDMEDLHYQVRIGGPLASTSTHRAVVITTLHPTTLLELTPLVFAARQELHLPFCRGLSHATLPRCACALSPCRTCDM